MCVCGSKIGTSQDLIEMVRGGGETHREEDSVGPPPPFWGETISSVQLQDWRVGAMEISSFLVVIKRYITVKFTVLQDAEGKESE